MHRSHNAYSANSLQSSVATGEALPRGAAERLLKPLVMFLGACFFVFSSPARAAVEVETVDVGHGVKAWYAETGAVPVVDVVISFEGAGHASDPAGKGGRAAFAASMLTEGTTTLDSAAFRRALEDNAITLTAETDGDRLNIHIYALRTHAAEAGRLLAEALGNPRLEQADQARMKADLTSLIARMDEWPSYHAARLLAGRGFKNHPYSNAPYGDAASLASLTTQDIQDYLRTYVTRGNILIAAAGDVDETLLEAMLEPLIDSLPANESGAVGVAKTSLQGAGETLNKTMPAPQTTVLFAAPAIARDDARFYAAFLLNHVLGGSGLTSRLADALRQKKGLVYGIDSELELKTGASVIRGSLETRNANVEAAIAEVKTVLAEMHSKGVSPEECAEAKSYVIGSFVRKLDSSGAVSNLLLAMQIHKLGTDYIEKRNGYFSDVQCSDVNAVASELLNPANFLFAVVGGVAEGEAASPIAPQAAPRH